MTFFKKIFELHMITHLPYDVSANTKTFLPVFFSINEATAAESTNNESGNWSAICTKREIIQFHSRSVAIVGLSLVACSWQLWPATMASNFFFL